MQWGREARILEQKLSELRLENREQKAVLDANVCLHINLMSVVSLGIIIIAYEKLGHCHVKTVACATLNFFGGQMLNSSSSPFLILSFQK